MTVRTCFFDMGNVLVYFSHDRMCRNVAKLAGWSEEQAREFLFGQSRQWQMERGELSEEQFHADFCDATGRAHDPEALAEAVADIFDLNETMVPVLNQLRSAGLRLVLLSNTSAAHLRYIERRFDVLQLLHDRVASFEVGAMKPDDRIFQAALGRAWCSPEECFYTDDIEDYVHRASALGIPSHLFRGTEPLIAELKQRGIL